MGSTSRPCAGLRRRCWTVGPMRHSKPCSFRSLKPRLGSAPQPVNRREPRSSVSRCPGGAHWQGPTGLSGGCRCCCWSPAPGSRQHYVHPVGTGDLLQQARDQPQRLLPVDAQQLAGDLGRGPQPPLLAVGLLEQARVLHRDTRGRGQRGEQLLVVLAEVGPVRPERCRVPIVAPRTTTGTPRKLLERLGSPRGQPRREGRQRRPDPPVRGICGTAPRGAPETTNVQLVTGQPPGSFGVRAPGAVVWLRRTSAPSRGPFRT